jgi:dipeptidyl aminopeptidase/acylaminoacyl peptidase
MLRRVAAPLVLLLAAALPSLAALPPLIPREVLFGNPERTQPRISPDGQRLSWLAPDKKNVLQVWVKTIGKDDEKIVTADKRRGIRNYSWARDNKTLLYLQDNDGDENFHIYGVDLAGGNVRDYTPIQGIRASIVDLDPSLPDTVLVSTNARNRTLFDVWRLTLSTGALTLDTENPGDVQGWVADRSLNVVAAQASTADGGTEIRVRDGAASPWRALLTVGPEEIVNLAGVSADGKSLILESSIGSDTARVVEKNIVNGAEKVIASSDEVDAGIILQNPNSYVIEAVSFEPGRRAWKVIDPSVKTDFEAIAKLADGDFNIVGRDNADRTWLVSFASDRAPTKFFSYDRASKKGTFLFTNQPKLENQQLAEMRPLLIKTRDGLPMHMYLTFPGGVEPKKLPMVLFPHGGPWGRDFWGFSSFGQLLANRGYLVLQPEFRASTGFGKKFLNAGDRQWGLKMNDDLLDAVDWAVKQGYADPKRVAIMGGSYGGYATLAALAFTPDVFSCGVDLFGPSNIHTLIHSIPPYWKTQRAFFDRRMGNVDDPKDAELIKTASPLFKAAQIKKPLLIAQGANDPRVKPAESEQIVDAIEKNHGKVTYVVYGDEGHGFARPENNIDFISRAETFLAGCLGGRSEPLTAERYPGSTAAVKAGGPPPSR